MQPVEIRLVKGGVTGYEVAESRHRCIMRAFRRNNQTDPLVECAPAYEGSTPHSTSACLFTRTVSADKASCSPLDLSGISYCENRHTAEPVRLPDGAVRR
ncbi:hypothetical protein GCM10020216_052230 [Nonomuraea helvata]